MRLNSNMLIPDYLKLTKAEREAMNNESEVELHCNDCGYCEYMNFSEDSGCPDCDGSDWHWHD